MGVDGGDRCALLDDDRATALGAEAAERQADKGASGRCDSDWDAFELWLVAPFTRAAAARDARQCLRKLGLVLCFALGRGFGRAQGVCILIVEATAAWPAILSPPYRDRASNVVSTTCEIAAFANAVYAMLTAWGLRSAMVAPKQQTLGLLTINCLALIVCTATPRGTRRDDVRSG